MSLVARAQVRVPDADDFGGRGVLLPWDDYVLWLRGRKRDHPAPYGPVILPPPWKPGQHWAHIGKTREGKTNFVIAKAKATRRYVMALDCKGNDPTLNKSGWIRVDGVPPHKRFPKDVQKALDEGTRPVRLIVGQGTRTREDDAANRLLMSQAVDYARQSGGWTLIVDEHQVATDQRMYRIGPEIARMAVSAASDSTSVEVCMQYISWTEKAPLRQASLVSFWRSRSRALFKALSLEIGRDWEELAGIADELPRYHVATVSDDLRAPVIVTLPPKVLRETHMRPLLAMLIASARIATSITIAAISVPVSQRRPLTRSRASCSWTRWCASKRLFTSCLRSVRSLTTSTSCACTTPTPRVPIASMESSRVWLAVTICFKRSNSPRVGASLIWLILGGLLRCGRP